MKYQFLPALLAVALVCLTGPASGQSPVVPAPVLPVQGQYAIDTHWSGGQPYYRDGKFLSTEHLYEKGAPPRQRIVALDALTGEKTALSEFGENLLDPAFLLDDYILSFFEPRNEIALVSRATGRIVGAKRLSDPVNDARIEGDTLILLQPKGISSFHIPDLAFLKEEKLEPGSWRFNKAARIGSNSTTRYVQDKRYGPSRSVTTTWFSIIPFDGSAARHVLFEPWKDATGRRNCGVRMGPFNERYAVVDRGCGHFLVIDLDKAEIAYEMPREALGWSFQAVLAGDFVVIQSMADSEVNTGPASIFELTTGREVARQTLPEGRIFGAASNLIVLHKRNLAQPGNTFTVYRMNAAVLRNTSRAAADLSAAIARARKAGDPFRAIEIMGDASPEPMKQALAGDAGRAWPWLDAASFRARMLAMHPTRAAEGVAAMEQLARLYPASTELKADLDQARKRAPLFDTDLAAREAAISQAWRPAAERPLLAEHTAVSDIKADGVKLEAHGDQIFMPCENCDGAGAIGYAILDRKSWRRVGALPVTTASGDAHIGSTAIAGDRLFAFVESDTPKPSAPNMFVYDLKSMKLIKSWHEDRGEAEATLLVFDGVNVGAYDCWGQPDRAFNALTLEAVPGSELEGQFCEYDDRSWSGFPGRFPPKLGERLTELKISATRANACYLVSTNRSEYPQRIFRLYRMEGDPAPIEFPRTFSQLDLGGTLFADGGKTAIVFNVSAYASDIFAFDIATGAYRQLFASTTNLRGSGATDGKTLFVFDDKSILAMDIATGAILDLIDVAQGLKHDDEPEFRIRRLMVDSGNLVVIGERRGVLLIDLAKFHAAADPANTPFATTARTLMRN